MSIEETIGEAVREVVRDEVRAVVLDVLPEVIRRATEPEYLGRQETAEFLGISVRKLDALLKNRKLPKVKRGRTVLVPMSAIHDYLDEAEIPARRDDDA